MYTARIIPFDKVDQIHTVPAMAGPEARDRLGTLWHVEQGSLVMTGPRTHFDFDRERAPLVGYFTAYKDGSEKAFLRHDLVMEVVRFLRAKYIMEGEPAKHYLTVDRFLIGLPFDSLWMGLSYEYQESVRAAFTESAQIVSRLNEVSRQDYASIILALENVLRAG